VLTFSLKNNKPKTTYPRDALALLGLLSALLYLFQFSTLAALAPMTPPGRYNSFAEFWSYFDRAGVSFGWTDGLLLILIGLVSLTLPILEWRRRSLSNLLAHILASETRTLWTLAFSGLVIARFYLAPGQACWTGDAPSHIAYAHLASSSLAQGEWPIWSNMMGSGTPYLQFYGFLFPCLVGLVNLLSRDLFFSLKLVLFVAHVMSSIGIYRFARLACRSRAAALFTGLAYLLCFWHAQQVLIMGRLPLSLFYTLLPWPFYFFERTRWPAHRLTAIIGGGISLALLAFTHPGYAFWATGLLALYALLRLAVLRRADLIPALLGLLITGVALGAFLTLPMWLERAATGLHSGLSLSAIPDPDWRQLFLWSNYHFPLFSSPVGSTWHGGYLGLSLILLALLGLCAPDRMAPRLPGAVCLVLVLGIALCYRSPLLQAIPVVTALNASRYLLFAVFFLSLLTGAGVSLLIRRLPTSRHRLIVCLVALLAIDLGPTTFQHLYSTGEQVDGLTSGEALDILADQMPDRDALPNYRIFTSTGQMHPALALSAAHLRNLPTFQSYHPGAVRAAFAFNRPVEHLLNGILESLDSPSELIDHPQADLVFDALALLNTRHLLINKEQTFHFNQQGFDHSPVLVSSSIAPFSANDLSPKERTARLVRNTGVDLPHRSCERIWLLEDETEKNLERTPTIDLLAHRVQLQRVELQLRLSAPGFVRLAYAWYPHLRVEVDGQQVSPWKTAGHYIALPLEAGEHQITLTPRLSPLRRSLLLFDLLFLILSGWLLWRRRS